MVDKKKMNFKELKKQFKSSAYFNQPNHYGKEGEDHINISIQSDTRLGKLLDPAYLKTINYQHIGKFNSVLSLWYWIRSENLDDNIRRLTGTKLKMYAEANGVFGNYVPNFKAIIAYATWIKLKGYPNFIKEIKELDPNIKLLSYHVIKSSNLRVCTNYAALIIEIMDEIFKAIRANKEPDFAKFVDKPSQAGLLYLEGVLSKILPPAKIEELKNVRVEEDVEDYELPQPESTEPSQSELESLEKTVQEAEVVQETV